jgi:hypothetical protein
MPLGFNGGLQLFIRVWPSDDKDQLQKTEMEKLLNARTVYLEPPLAS